MTPLAKKYFSLCGLGLPAGRETFVFAAQSVTWLAQRKAQATQKRAQRAERQLHPTPMEAVKAAGVVGIVCVTSYAPSGAGGRNGYAQKESWFMVGDDVIPFRPMPSTNWQVHIDIRNAQLHGEQPQVTKWISHV